MGPRPHGTEDRWRPRRITAGFLRALIFLVPIAAGFAVGGMVAAALPPPTSLYEIGFWWIAIIAVATVTSTAVDRVARRFLPLTVLLRMTMLFPDAAPSRLRTARRAGNVTELRRRIVEAGTDGGDTDLAEMAELVLALSTALTNHDRRTRGHSERTRAYTDMIAEEMGIGEADRDRLRWAALLHDVGKLEVPTEILNKESALDDAEWELVKQHPLNGMRLVAPLIPWLGEWAETIEHHHERYDGTGYPHGLAGEEICLGARIVTVADAFDVMTSGRSYQSAMTPAAARREIAGMAGIQFDPTAARALMTVSLGRLRWSAGPLAAIAQIPVFRGIPQVGRDLAMLLTTSAVMTTGFMTGVVPTPEGTSVTVTEIIEVVIAGEEIHEAAPAGVGGFPLAAEDPDPGRVVAPETTTTIAPSTPTSISTTTVAAAPVARDDTAATIEEQAITIDVLANDDDADGDLDPASLTITSGPARGTASLAGTSIRYTPTKDTSGTDEFSYRVCDRGDRCDTALVTVVVTPVNDPPIAPARAAATDAGVVVTIPLGYSDPDGDVLQCALETPPSVGAATVPADCSELRYSPPSDHDGVVTVQIRVTDGTVAVAGTVTITVRGPVAGAVVANDDGGSVGKNGSVNLSVLANDTGPVDASTLQVGSVSSGSATTLGTSGRIRYDAAAGFTGTATVTYTVCNSTGACDSATVRIEVG